MIKKGSLADYEVLICRDKRRSPLELILFTCMSFTCSMHIWLISLFLSLLCAVHVFTGRHCFISRHWLSWLIDRRGNRSKHVVPHENCSSYKYHMYIWARATAVCPCIIAGCLVLCLSPSLSLLSPFPCAHGMDMSLCMYITILSMSFCNHPVLQLGPTLLLPSPCHLSHTCHPLPCQQTVVPHVNLLPRCPHLVPVQRVKLYDKYLVLCSQSRWCLLRPVMWGPHPPHCFPSTDWTRWPHAAPLRYPAFRWSSSPLPHSSAPHAAHTGHCHGYH